LPAEALEKAPRTEREHLIFSIPWNLEKENVLPKGRRGERKETNKIADQKRPPGGGLSETLGG